MTVDLDKHDIEEFAAIGGVTHVAPNARAHHPTPPQTERTAGVENTGDYTYGLEQIDIPGFEETFGDRGANATVSIIDDGVSNPDEGHPDLEFAQEATAADGTVQTGGLGSAGSHGEHVAGTATGAADPAGDVPRYGVAPEANLIMINAFEGGANLEDILASVQYSAEQDADVVSMSLGFDSTTGHSVVLNVMENTVQDANDAGTLVIGSAGNEGSGDSGGPATSPGAEFSSLSVGASNAQGGIATFSSGDVITPHQIELGTEDAPYPEHYPREFVKPDVSAPGAQILSAGPVGTVIDDDAATYSYSDGTSMAAPHVAGAAALVQSATEADLAPKTIEMALAETADKPDNDFAERHGRDMRYGTGIINVTAATEAVQDGTMSIEGTVTDTDGNPIVGASVSTGSDALTSTNASGDYTLKTVSDSVDVTVDAFGYASTTQTVDSDADPVDATLADELAVDLFDDQSPYVEFGGEIEATADVRNVENLTVSLSGETDVSPDDLTLEIDGDEVTFGEAHDLGGHDGEITVTVDIADDADVEEGSLVGLEHAFEGLGDSTAVSTGPTSLTEELDPAFYELSNFDAPDGQIVGEAIPATVEVTNTGQVTPAGKGIEFFATDGETEIGLPPEALDIAPDETVEYEVLVGGVESYFDAGEVIEIGMRTGDITSTLFGDLIAEEDVEDTATSAVALHNEGTDFAVTLDGPVEASAGEEITVDATIENVGNEGGTQAVEFRMDGETLATESVDLNAFELGAENTSSEFTFTADVSEDSGVYIYGVSTEDDTATAPVGVDVMVPSVTVVSSSGDYGNQTVDLLERGLGDQPAHLSYTDAAAVDAETISNTDVFVFHDLGDSEELITDVEEDPFTTAVYLEQFADANAIADRSDVLNDPESSVAAFGDGNPVEFEVVADHPLFDGVAEEGERVPIHTYSDADRAFFEGADGETLAEVGVPGQENDGAVATVDPETGSVLLGTIAPNSYESESDFTDDAARILGNSISVAQEGIVTDTSTSIDTDFIGVVDDDERITVEASHIVSDEGVVDGENVTFTVGGEPVATAMVNEGNAEATFDPATLDFEAGETVAVTLEEFAIAEAATVETVHETRDLEDGFNLLSVPQAADITTEGVSALNTWDTANETYESVTQSEFDSAADLNNGLYVSATDDDARAGFTFSDDVPVASTAELANGWTLTGSNFAIDSPDQGDARSLDDDLIEVDPSALSVYSSDFNQQYDGQSTIGAYEAYWTFNDETESAERAIISPAYTPEDRQDVLGYEDSNFTVTSVDVTEPSVSGEATALDVNEQTVDVEATVTNDGGPDTQFVDLQIDGAQEGSFELADRSLGLSLDEGEQATVTLTYTPTADDPSAIDLRVATEDDTSDAETAALTGGQFDVSINGADSTTSVAAGEDAVVNATIQNSGDLDAMQTIDFAVNGTVQETTEVTLDAGASTTVEFTYATSIEDDGVEATISSDDANASTALTVGEAVVESLDASLDRSTIEVGNTTSLTVTATMTDGTEETVTGNATLASGNTSVVSVADDGTVTAEGAGSATITAEYGGESATAEIAVETASG